MQISYVVGTTLLSLRVRRTLKTVVKCKFYTLRSNPLVTSCSSDAQNCGDMQILHPLVISRSSDVQNCGAMQILYIAKQPFRHFVLVRRSKLWCNANFIHCEATFSSLRARHTSKTVVQCELISATANPFVTSCSLDVQNCGKTMIFVCRERPRASLTCFIHFCARRCSETCIWKFLLAHRCSETHILILLDEPSRRIRWVDRAKL